MKDYTIDDVLRIEYPEHRAGQRVCGSVLLRGDFIHEWTGDLHAEMSVAGTPLHTDWGHDYGSSHPCNWSERKFYRVDWPAYAQSIREEVAEAIGYLSAVTIIPAQRA